MSEKTLLIINPNSAGGATGKRRVEIEQCLKQLGVSFDSRLTKGIGHATEITRFALRRGYTRIVAVGGDGTLNEVVNGFFQESSGDPIDTNATIGFIPSGTGGDFRRTAGIPVKLEEACSVLVNGAPRPIDVGKIAYIGPKQSWRVFINIADCGIGGEIVGRVNRGGKWLPGRLVYLYHSLISLLSYQPRLVRIEANGVANESVVQNVVIANGRYFGGKMLVAPMADIDDGQLDLIVIKAKPLWRNLWEMRHLLKGKHVGRPGIDISRISSVRISPQGPPIPFDVDGEQIGSAPAMVTCLPGAVRLWLPR